MNFQDFCENFLIRVLKRFEYFSNGLDTKILITYDVVVFLKSNFSYQI